MTLFLLFLIVLFPVRWDNECNAVDVFKNRVCEDSDQSIYDSSIGWVDHMYDTQYTMVSHNKYQSINQSE